VYISYTEGPIPALAENVNLFQYEFLYSLSKFFIIEICFVLEEIWSRPCYFVENSKIFNFFDVIFVLELLFWLEGKVIFYDKIFGGGTSWGGLFHNHFGVHLIKDIGGYNKYYL
jgi:hypothetical protein